MYGNGRDEEGNVGECGELRVDDQYVVRRDHSYIRPTRRQESAKSKEKGKSNKRDFVYSPSCKALNLSSVASSFELKSARSNKILAIPYFSMVNP